MHVFLVPNYVIDYALSNNSINQLQTHRVLGVLP